MGNVPLKDPGLKRTMKHGGSPAFRKSFINRYLTVQRRVNYQPGLNGLWAYLATWLKIVESGCNAMQAGVNVDHSHFFGALGLGREKTSRIPISVETKGKSIATTMTSIKDIRSEFLTAVDQGMLRTETTNPKLKWYVNIKSPH